MRAQLRVKADTPEAMASCVLRLLESELVRAKPTSLVRIENGVTVRGGLFRLVSNWNFLVPFTTATFTVEIERDGVLVLVDASLAQLAVACGFASMMFGSLSLVSRSFVMVFVAGVVLPWGWLFGMNYLLARARMSRLLTRVSKMARAEVDATARDASLSSSARLLLI